MKSKKSGFDYSSRYQLSYRTDFKNPVAANILRRLRYISSLQVFDGYLVDFLLVILREA